VERTFASRLLCWATPLALALAVVTVDRPALGADTSVRKALSKKLRGRLPPYYRSVVTDQQREQIYGIQEEYKSKIEALEVQLKALTKERKDKIAAVLTPEQRKLVEEAAAKGARAAKTKGEVAPPAESPPATEPAEPKPEK
jgi:hypothetical protein